MGGDGAEGVSMERYSAVRSKLQAAQHVSNECRFNRLSPPTPS